MKSEDNKNLLMAIGLSILVMVGWNYFYGMPQMEKQKQGQQIGQPAAPTVGAPTNGAAVPQPAAGAVQAPAAPAGAVLSAAQALSLSPRLAIETPRLRGSLALKGGRIDDLKLLNYRKTVDANSENITLLAPNGGPHGYYAEFGWVNAAGAAVAVPNQDTLWQASSTVLKPDAPVTLSYDNGQGFIFKRKISVDQDYMFTIADSVENKSAASASLHPYSLVLRQGTPETLGFYILHEGLIGFLGDQGLQEMNYKDAASAKSKSWKAVTGGWLGFTDKYWATAIIPDQKTAYEARFAAGGVGTTNYQTDILGEAKAIPAGGEAVVVTSLFAGAKEVTKIDAYEASMGIKRFDLMIDWGWFHFITKPLFKIMHVLYNWVGNFGVAILLVTVLVKGIFFPLASKSYESMARMKAMQPQMADIKERYADDRMKQQQAMMELYKKEKINPMAGCLPVLIQIPVFFALYKVLFVTIEMRHAPFFGWIKDLAAPDPTTIFNLFGLLPFNVPEFLQIGIWPIIMGITMWLQMKMNPEPTDPIQKSIFGWMPVMFTFMLGAFPAGLVIYWAWNNLLSIAQQYFILRKNGVKVELWDNLRGVIAFFNKKA